MALVQDEVDTIAGWGKKCLLAFREVFLAEDLNSTVMIRSRILFRQPQKPTKPVLTLSDLHSDWEQFRVWAKNLGVFAADNGSLDFRLREAEEVAQGLIVLLKGIQNDLDQSLLLLKGDRVIDTGDIDDEDSSESESSSDSSSATGKTNQSIKLSAWELQRRLEGIADAINKLMKLAEAIRGSGVQSRTLKAARYVHWEDGVNQTEIFEQQYLPQVLQHRFGLEEPLLTRIGKAISLRRRRFQYQAAHQKRLDYGMIAVEKSLGPHDRIAKDTASSQNLALAPPKKSQLHRSGESTRIPASSLQPPTRATTFQKFGPRKTSPSTIVSRPRKSSGSHVEIPQLPPIKNLANHFQCPYCRLLVDRSKRTDSRWRRHVIEDLQPFVCIESECKSGDISLESQDQWVEHQKWEHSMKWWCEGEETDHEPLSFNNPEEYSLHLSTEHMSDVDERRVSNQVSIAGRPSLLPFSCCPFCSFVPRMQGLNRSVTAVNNVIHDITAQEQLEDHIADELLTMFLLAFPGRDDIWDTESDTQRTGRPRSSAQDLLEIPLEFEDVVDAGRDEIAVDDQDDGWGPPVPASFWEMVWSSPRLQHTVRESYTGPQDDSLLKDIERVQMTIEEEPPEVWIPSLIVTDVAGEESFEVVEAKQLAEEANGQYYLDPSFYSNTFSIVAGDYDHDGVPRPDLTGDDFAVSFPPV